MWFAIPVSLPQECTNGGILFHGYGHGSFDLQRCDVNYTKGLVAKDTCVGFLGYCFFELSLVGVRLIREEVLGVSRVAVAGSPHTLIRDMNARTAENRPVLNVR